MSPLLIGLYLLHVGAGVYWMGSSFLVALAKGKGAEKQQGPQMIAALLAIGIGTFLWRQMHPGAFGRMEGVLALGGVLAFAAMGVQGALVSGSLRRLRNGGLAEPAARARITRGSRISAILLALAFLSMVGSYHV